MFVILIVISLLVIQWGSHWNQLPKRDTIQSFKRIKTWPVSGRRRSL